MFTVAYVLGVTPGKWAGIWNERMPRHPLTLSQVSPDEALAALASGAADVALLRLPVADESLSAIPLYVEKAVVVVPKDHVIEALDSVTLADLDDVLDGEWVANVELVAANAGVAVMPQSVARALSRKDVVARPVSDGPETRVALVWANTTPEVEEFIGIVRGRTANSSRGEPTPPTPKPVRAPKAKPVRSTKQRRR
jgi:DNA-binding transcriptional LysR family regulator